MDNSDISAADLVRRWYEDQNNDIDCNNDFVNTDNFSDEEIVTKFVTEDMDGNFDLIINTFGEDDGGIIIDYYNSIIN